MIDELKKKGYDPDPVKAWKIRQNRDEALVSVCSFLLNSGQSAWIGHSEHESFNGKVKFLWIFWLKELFLQGFLKLS